MSRLINNAIKDNRWKIYYKNEHFPSPFIPEKYTKPTTFWSIDMCQLHCLCFISITFMFVTEQHKLEFSFPHIIIRSLFSVSRIAQIWMNRRKSVNWNVRNTWINMKALKALGCNWILLAADDWSAIKSWFLLDRVRVNCKQKVKKTTRKL